MKSATPPEFVVRITELRDNLGFTYRQIAATDEAVIVQRYSRQDVAMVPLWEWCWLKEIKQAVRDGRILWPADGLENEPEPAGDMAG